MGGAVADAVDKRRLLLWANGGQAVAAALLALNALHSVEHLWVIYVLASVQAGLATVARPAFDSTIPRLVPKDLLPSAIAVAVVAGTFGFLVGPLLGGTIIAVFGLAVAYLVDAGSFLCALGFVAAMAPVPPHHQAIDPAFAPSVRDCGSPSATGSSPARSWRTWWGRFRGCPRPCSQPSPSSWEGGPRRCTRRAPPARSWSTCSAAGPVASGARAP